MNNQLSTTLRIFDTSKDQRAEIVAQLIDDVFAGNQNPVDVLIQLKCMNEIIDGVLKNKEFMTYAVTESEKFGKSHERHNAKISVRETGVRYNFGQCGDDELNELLAMKSELDERIKKRQEFVKTIPIEGIEVVSLDGIVSAIYPPSKESTTSVVVTLK